MITYSVSGVPLDDAAGRWRLLRGTLVGPGLSVRSVDTTLPGVDGAMPGAYEPLDAPTLLLKVKVTGATHTALLANYGALLAVLAPTGDVQVVRTVDGMATTITARGKSVTEPDFSAAGRSITVTATLRLPGVCWRGASADWAKVGAVSGTSYALTSLAGSTAPVDDALILVTGPVAQPKVTCASAWATLNLTLASAEKALIDCAAWTVRRGSGVTFAGGGTDASGTLATSGGPYLLRLRPAMVAADPVVTAVQVALSGSGFTSATGISVRARPALVA